MRAKISAVPPAAKGTITDTCLEGYASSAFSGAADSSIADARTSLMNLIEVSSASACYWFATAPFLGGRLERRLVHLQDFVTAQIARVVVEQAANGMGLVRHDAETVPGNTKRGQPHLDAEIGAEAISGIERSRRNVALRQAERMQHRDRLCRGRRHVERQRMREDHRAGEAMRHMMPCAKWIGHRVASRRIHGTEAIAAIE